MQLYSFSHVIFIFFKQDINHVYYETEYRIEWCHTNSTFVPCFLFARKFSRGAAMRLLGDGVIDHFEVSALLANSNPWDMKLVLLSIQLFSRTLISHWLA